MGHPIILGWSDLGHPPLFYTSSIANIAVIVITVDLES
jgi:hypothetical protein